MCSHNKWNPYSEEVKNTPDVYWDVQFHMINLEMKNQWDYLHKPAAELVAQIANPQVFKVWHDHMKREEEKKKLSKNNSNKGFYESKDIEGGRKVIHSESEANSYYDPNKGVIDQNGNVLIPKENFDKVIGLDGVAISY